MITSPRTVTFDPLRSSRIIVGNESLMSNDQQSILTYLGFESIQNGEKTTVVVPQWRGGADITHTEDIVEEIARIYGYDTITDHDIITPLRQATIHPLITLRRQTENFFVQSYNCTQIETYPWFDQSYHGSCEIDLDQCVRLRNPLAPETSHLRDRLAPLLIDATRTNHKFFDTIRVMDIGQVWTT
jgi:phenylalanyl-tRNA synthetase beta chain